jgi:hypothetical protein
MKNTEGVPRGKGLAAPTASTYSVSHSVSDCKHSNFAPFLTHLIDSFFSQMLANVGLKLYLCSGIERNIMAKLIMDIQDKSLVQKVKQACKMIVGVASVKLDINV